MPEKIHRFEINFETGIQRDIDNNHCRTMRVVWVDPSSVIPRWTGQIPKPPQDFAIAYGHPHCPMPTRPCPQPTVETPVRLKLLTFGLENCDSELVDRCRDFEKGGAEAQFDDKSLHAAMERLGYNNVDLIIDARCFPDPREKKVAMGHIGIHPQVIHRIVHHDEFPGFLRMFHRQWLRVNKNCSKQKSEWIVAFYCKSGTHRSVALAEIIRSIFSSDEGFEVLAVTHLAKPKWGKRICKGTCLECTFPSQHRQHDLQHALQMWQQHRVPPS